MKSKHGLIFGFAAVFLAAICSFTACNKDDDDPPPPAQKKLTITGLDAYNGKYAMAMTNGTSTIIGAVSYKASDGSFVLVQISGGKAVLPLWSANQSTGDVSEYNGSDTVSGYCMIFENSSASMGGSQRPIGSGSFTNVDLSASDPTSAVTIQPSS